MEVAFAANGKGISGWINSGYCPLCDEGHQTCVMRGLWCVRPECRNPHHRTQAIEGSSGMSQV